jgi:ribosome-binding factor A
MSIRTEKVASTMKKILAMPIGDFAREYYPGSLVTVTSVRLSPDLRLAKVFLSFFGQNISPGAFIEILEDKKGYIRSIVGSKVRLRYTPDIKFFIDDTLDQIEHIQSLLDSVKKTENPE